MWLAGSVPVLPPWFYAAALAALESHPLVAESSQSSVAVAQVPATAPDAPRAETIAPTDFSSRLEDRQAALQKSAVHTGSWSEGELRALVDVMAMVAERKRTSEKFRTMSHVELYFDYVPAFMAQKLGYVRPLEHVEENSKKRGRARKASHNVYYKKAAEIKRWVSDYQAATNPDMAMERPRPEGPTGGGYSGDEGSDLDERPERPSSRAPKTLTPLQVGFVLYCRLLVQTSGDLHPRVPQAAIAEYYLQKFPNKATGVGLADNFETDRGDLGKRPRTEPDEISSTGSGGGSSEKKSANRKLIEDVFERQQAAAANTAAVQREQVREFIGPIVEASVKLATVLDQMDQRQERADESMKNFFSALIEKL